MFLIKESSSPIERTYPVYIVLFSNDTDFGKVIRRATGSDFSHAVISLDPSLNNMYSFSDIPYNHGAFGDGFVRESLWSPMYRKNKFFVVSVVFVTREEYTILKNKIDYFIKNHNRFRYNDVGLIQYYLNFKNTKNISEETKKKYFCSEFVSYMLKSVNVDGFNDVLLSPEDIRHVDSVKVLKEYTIATFKEEDLKKETKKALEEYKLKTVNESFIMDFNSDYLVIESGIKDIIKSFKNKINQTDVTPYTYFVDWKKLYEYFMKLFKDSAEFIRFDLFELIVRYCFVPLKKATDNVTELFIKEMDNIYNAIKSNSINSVDLNRGVIYYTYRSAKNEFNYKEFIGTNI
ncbi:MAG: hypothetical protein PHF63_00695 [Herbinix sp.]|nr:hypothetical protein [Herbinix sp.]